MEHKAKLSISRPSCSNGDKFISIKVEDVDAGITFLALEIDYASFAEVITGMSMVDCSMEVRNLKNVGKSIERDNIEFPISYEGYRSERKDAAIEAARSHTPEGWEFSEYFGSQNSFFSKDGETWARTSIYRWVEKTNPTPQPEAKTRR